VAACKSDWRHEAGHRSGDQLDAANLLEHLPAESPCEPGRPAIGCRAGNSLLAALRKGAPDVGSTDVPCSKSLRHEAFSTTKRARSTLLVNVASLWGCPAVRGPRESLRCASVRRVSRSSDMPVHKFGAQERARQTRQDLLQHELHVNVTCREKLEVTATATPAYQQMTADGRRRGSKRRHPLELREVPRGSRR